MDCLVMADIAQTVCDWLDEPVVGFDPDPGLFATASPKRAVQHTALKNIYATQGFTEPCLKR